MKVKICGITNIEDAVLAVESGADAIGFVFAESPRKVGIEEVCQIKEVIPSSIITVGVFANQTADEISQIMKETGLSSAQIHGSLDSLEPQFGIIRALRVKSVDDINQAAKDPILSICWAILLDTHVEGKMGGTGKTFDWNLAKEARKLGKDIILAGGLNPSNVSDAIRIACPDWVDVSTGVEAYPGKKSHEKIKEFIRNAKKCV
ncbi:MAG: phosphoribosylanthranilate isomerase [Armatimonadetes bacterium]|nr:phosphoribosylanthranilate isomerase [Armatimonadota bacterium]